MEIKENEIIDLSTDQRENTVEIIKNIHSHTAFLAQLIQSDRCGRDDVQTHMSLLRNYYDDLAALFDYDPISQEIDRAQSQCRLANLRVKAMRDQIGRSVSAEQATAKLESLERTFCTWYQLSGLHYASLAWYVHGLSVKFSDDLENPEDRIDSVQVFGDKNLAEKIQDKIPYLFEPDKYDIVHDSSRISLLDTDKNKKNLTQAILANFPNTRVNGFESHCDHGHYLLRVNLFVPWTDIEAWLVNITPGQNKPHGMYYNMLSDLKAYGENSKYAAKAGPALTGNVQRDIKHIQTVIDVYEKCVNAELDDGKRLKAPLLIQWKDPDKHVHVLNFSAGAPINMILQALEQTFQLDIKTDLAGI